MIDQPISQDEINQAWEYWYPLVFGYFFRRVNSREDVEDLTANTLSALFLNPNVQNPKGFVWQTAKNQLYKYIEQKGTQPHSMDIQDPIMENYASSYNLESNYINQEEDLENIRSPHYQAKIDQIIDCCKKQLNEQDYNLVCLSVIDNHNSTEIGAKLDLKPDTVRQKLKRSFGKLRQHCVELWEVLKTADVTAQN